MSVPASPAGGERIPRRLRGILSLDDFEAAARRRLPRPIFGYVHGAAEGNHSVRENRAAFGDYGFSTRVLVDVSARSQQVALFGKTYASPFGIAPMGITGMSAYRADIGLVCAARAAGIPAIMSGASTVTLEEMAQRAPGTWFQAYVQGDPSSFGPLLARVAQAGFEVLVVTVDVPVSANRENNVRTGFSTPLRPGLRLAYDGITRPAWLFGTFLRTLLRHGMPHFENTFAQRGAPLLSARAARDFSQRDNLTWDHLADIRRRWQGALVVKGILDVRDAAEARRHGVDGIIVSNHGGRQLDGAVAPLRVLPQIAEAAGDMAVMMDSGIRRGTDVLKALALGARCVFLGRPFNYAAAVGGEAGVAHAIRLLREEVDRDMAMLGLCHCGEARRDILVPRA
ncbi:MAG TPA: alpha-hydroxy acid oxidase [Bordetella sp.]